MNIAKCWPAGNRHIGSIETLYAMLHTDAGEIGTWEFPGGPDAPVKVDDAVITPPFNVTGGLPAVLPETGGETLPWASILLVMGGLALFSGLGLTLARRARQFEVINCRKGAPTGGGR